MHPIRDGGVAVRGGIALNVVRIAIVAEARRNRHFNFMDFISSFLSDFVVTMQRLILVVVIVF